MWSFLVLTLISLGNADKLNRLYLPPPNANLAGGSPGDILAPKQTFLDTNEYGVPRTFQTTSGPEIILEDAYSSITTPTYTDFSDPKIDQVVTKTIPINDVITKNLRDGIVTQNLNRNNLFPNSVRGPDEDYNSIISFPDAQGSISPNKFISSLPSNRGANVGDDSLSISQTKRVNNNPLAEIKSENVNFAPVSTNVENIYRYVVPSSLNQGPTIDNVRSRFPSTVIANAKNRSPERAQAEADRQAIILNYENQVNPASYTYSFDTSNGIHSDENGTILDGTRAQGSYSYIGDDGKLYNVAYTADENGFQPRGDHLPTSPPIPEVIQKALEKIAENERNGIFDDGSYDERKYGHKNFERIGNKKPALGKKQPFGRTSTSPIGKSDFLDTATENKPYWKPIITSTESAQGDDEVIVEEQDDEYDDMKQVIEPVEFESNNKHRADNTLLSKEDIDTKTPSLKNQGINLPSFKYGQNSDDPSIQINTLPNSHPSMIRGNENIDVYSTNAPLTEAGYQYLIPTNRLITKSDIPSASLDINNEGLVDITPSTFRPFSDTKSPQTYSLNKNQGVFTYPQAYNKLMSPIVLGDSVANKVNPQTGVFRNDDITNGYKPNVVKNNYQGKNDEIKDYSIYEGQNKKPYDSNSQDDNINFDTNIPENQQFGQKHFKPSSINNNAQFYSTTPMSSKFPLNLQAYNPMLISNPTGKLGLFTTTKLNTVTTPVTKIGDENVYEVHPTVNGNVSPVESTDVFGNTSELLKTPKITGGPLSSGIKDFEINHGNNGPKNFYKIPNTEFRGEDFSGPKQPQRYDPKTGYHY